MSGTVQKLTIEFVKLRKFGEGARSHVLIEITTKAKLPKGAILVKKADTSKPGLTGLAEYAIGSKDEIDKLFGLYNINHKTVPLTKKDHKPWTPKKHK